MLAHRARHVISRALRPLARALARTGVTPNTITVLGAAAVVAAALALFGTGHLILGPIIVGVLLLLDSLDGLVAREGSGPTAFGSFLDSTMDRIADAAVFIGLAVFFLRFTDGAALSTGVLSAVACLALGGVVPYVRAKAEALGHTADIGLAERGDRLLITVLATLAVGLGLNVWVLIVALLVLAVASAITVAQRIGVVARQERSR